MALTPDWTRTVPAERGPILQALSELTVGGNVGRRNPPRRRLPSPQRRLPLGLHLRDRHPRSEAAAMTAHP